MTGPNMTGGSPEQQKLAVPEQSNLSPTAQLVNGMMKEYIMPVLRAAGLINKANEIIKAKLQPDDPEVIKFSLACREKQSEIHAKAKENNCDEKREAVIANYFSKLITTVKSSSESFKPEAPKEITA